MIRCVAVMLAALALALGGALPAQAATADAVLVSTDGIAYASTIPAGLFESTVLVPGASHTATLYVKNNSSVRAELFVSAADVVSSGQEFADAITLRATSSASSGSAVRLGRIATCTTLLAEVLAPGAVTRLTIRLAMADVDLQVAQGDTITANLGLGLQQADTSVAPVSGCDLGGIQLPVLGLPSDGGLAFTGGAVLYPALMTVGALLGVGLFLTLAARRRGRHAR